jgi:hypothetical protein
MRRLLTTLFLTLALLGLSVMPTYAQSIRITGVSFSLGSVIATGKLRIIHTHPEDVHVRLHTEGQAEITCSDGDYSYTHGHARVEAEGSTTVTADQFNRRGVARFHVQTGDPHLIEPVHCSHGTPQIGFVAWDHATLTAIGAETSLEAQNRYVCETVPDCITCKRVR